MFKKVLLLSAVLAISACSSTPDKNVDAEAMAAAQAAEAERLRLAGIADREAMEANRMAQERAAAEQAAALLRQKVVYFDYDSSQVGEEYMPILDTHARNLRDNPNMRLRLEGHSDERGSREYNIALGERRAEAVRRALLLRGAAHAQLLVISYGEEKPAVLGAGENSWTKNRRVEIVYQ